MLPGGAPERSTGKGYRSQTGSKTSRLRGWGREWKSSGDDGFSLPLSSQFLSPGSVLAETYPGVEERNSPPLPIRGPGLHPHAELRVTVPVHSWALCLDTLVSIPVTRQLSLEAVGDHRCGSPLEAQPVRTLGHHVGWDTTESPAASHRPAASILTPTAPPSLTPTAPLGTQRSS